MDKLVFRLKFLLFFTVYNNEKIKEIREEPMGKKRILINIIGWIYAAILTILYFSGSVPFLTMGFSGFIVFLLGLFMVLYNPRIEKDLKKWFTVNKQY